MQETTGNLASGNRYRVTAYALQILDPAGAILKEIDLAQIADGSRDGRVVNIRERSGATTAMECTTIDEAGRLEGALRPVVVPVPPQPQTIILQKQKGGLGKKLGIGCLALIGIIVVIIIAVAASGGGSKKTPTAASGNTVAGSTTPTAVTGSGDRDKHAALAVGSSGEVESVADRKAKVTINQIQDDAKSSNQFLQPAAGSRYYAMQVTIEATGTKTVSTGSWRVRTKDGFEFDQKFVTDVGGESLSFGDITSGGKRQGWVVFEIPAAAQVQWVRYDENVVVAGDLFFDAT